MPNPVGTVVFYVDIVFKSRNRGIWEKKKGSNGRWEEELGPTLKETQKALGAHSFLSRESILGTWTRRISRGPDPDWILWIACKYSQYHYDCNQ